MFLFSNLIYLLQFIFYKMPFLCGLTDDELLPKPFWQFCQGQEKNVPLLFRAFNDVTLLSKQWKTVWRGKFAMNSYIVRGLLVYILKHYYGLYCYFSIHRLLK